MVNPHGPQQSSHTNNIAAPVLPLETGLVTFLMALSLILMPLPQHQSSQALDAMLLGATGFILFFAAKISLFLHGAWGTWGPAPMRLPYKLAYVTGYLLMVLSAIGLYRV